MRENVLSFEALGGKIQLAQLCEKNSLPMSCGSGEAVQNSTRSRRRMENSYSSVPRILEFSIFSEGTIIEPVFEVHIVKILDGCGTHLTLLYPEKQSVSWIRFMIRKKSSGPVTNCSQTFRDQKEVIFMKKKEEPLASRKLVGALSAFLVQTSLHTKRTIPTNEWKWKVILCTFTRRRILGSCTLQMGYTNGASLWPRWTATWWFIGI